MRLHVRHVRSLLGAFGTISIFAASASGQSGGTSAAALDSLARAPVRANRTVGLVAAVVRGNDTVLMKGYGKANVEWDVPMPADAMFEVGSIAKQFTAASILLLVDQGKLSLDDEITKWLPTFRTPGGKVTLRHMLNHTSGLAISGGNLGIWDHRVTRDSAFALMRADRFQFPTGHAQAYNNNAFVLLGLIVEKASGMSYEQFVETKIFEPLGMKRSMYCNSIENIPRRAHGYGVQNGTIRRAPMVAHVLPFAAGSICSTAPDLVIWLKALHGSKVLSPKSYAEMTTQSRLENGMALQYGLGIKVGEDFRGLKYIGHGGAGPGFRADALWYPDAQLAVVVLSNTSPANFAPAEVTGDLARAVLPWPRPEFKFYTGDASELIGKYEFVMGGNQPSFSVEVTQTPTGLAFSRSGARPVPLPWVGGLTFYAQENVTFTFRRANGDSGPVTELRRDDAGNHYILRRQP